MSSEGKNQCVKVVIINTKYVETDAVSFKDVVQRLTGKDSMVAYEAQEPIPKTQQFFKKNEGKINYGRNTNVLESSNNSISSASCGVNGLMSRSNSSVLMRNISFKEFERMFREVPPMEEFWGSDY